MAKPIAVKNIMTKKVITFKPEQNIHEVIDCLVKNKISGGSVVDEEGNLIGIISEKDCLKTTVKSSYYDGMGALVSDLMSSNPDTVEAHESVHNTAQKFLDCHYRRFPVVENGKLVGQVSRRDVLKVLQSIPH